MAKRLINNTQELMDRAQEMRIDTEGKSIQVVAQEVIARLMSGYDEYYMYIDNYKQMKQAEQRNHEIDDEVASIKKTVAIIEEQEDTTMMNANETTATNNNATVVKEETTMKNTTNNLATRILDKNRTERLVYVWEMILHVTKTTDELYIKKDELVQFLFDNDIISRMPSKNELKRTKRQEFVDILDTAVQNLIKNKVITPINAVPVGDLEITHDNAPQQEAPKTDARAKTDKLFALIKACAVDNNKKGYGFTISSFMLQACILNAGAGVEKFKGHTVTEEEAQMTKTVYQWLLKNNYVKPIVYSVAEDEKVRVYMDGYTGRTDSAKTKMIPYSQSKGYTAKKVTSFLVTLS